MAFMSERMERELQADKMKCEGLLNSSNERIGILTFQSADNYGAVLQNYALQRSIRLIGGNPITIDYQCPEINNTYGFIWNKESIKTFLISLINRYYWKKKRRRFATFRKNYLALTESCDFNTISEYEDCFKSYIVGSDQVWNIDLIKKNNIDIYTLKGVKNKPKYSYAASAGNSIIESEELLNNLTSFNELSVRESSLAAFLNRKGIESHVDCDPVFLLDKNEWETVVPAYTREGYVYIYSLGGNAKLLCDKLAHEVAREKSLRVLDNEPVSKKNYLSRDKGCGDGPLQFLAKIKNADIIIASSFHAVAFSLIFEKEFLAVLHDSTGNRVYDLLEYLGLTDRIVHSSEDIHNREISPIEYAGVRMKLKTLSETSLKNLKRICK